jgi:hypothetical protein
MVKALLVAITGDDIRNQVECCSASLVDFVTNMNNGNL